MRPLVALIIAVVMVCAMVASLRSAPAEPPLMVDIESPGPWSRYIAAPMGNIPSANALLAPCPLTPQNLMPKQPAVVRA